MKYGRYARVKRDLIPNKIATNQGWFFDTDKQQWVTPHLRVARSAFGPNSDKLGPMEDYARLTTEWSRAREPLHPTSELPQLYRDKFFPYQLAGLQYLLDKKTVLLGDEMGLGKTAQAIGCLMIARAFPALIVCPASLKENWSKEIKMWATREYTEQVVYPKTKIDEETDILIINYDILKSNVHVLRRINWSAIILDECHKVKNPRAQRTKAVFGLNGRGSLDAEYRIGITGTPILNRPEEMYSFLRWLEPCGWPNKGSYLRRYCDLKRMPWGLVSAGAGNLDELQTKLRSTILLRRTKVEVLKQLPTKIRQIVEISDKTNTIVEKESKIFGEVLTHLGIESEDLSEEEYRNVVKALSSNEVVGFGEISTLRRELAESKVAVVVEHLHSCIESSGKVVCFAHHKSVIQALAEAMEEYNPTGIMGSTPVKQRQGRVEQFQRDPECRLFIGNIQAAGVGITLTAASHVVFAELDWVAGNVTQAEDRCHRIGQEHSVLVQHLVLANSMDAKMAKAIVHKQEITESALDELTLEEMLS